MQATANDVDKSRISHNGLALELNQTVKGYTLEIVYPYRPHSQLVGKHHWT